MKKKIVAMCATVAIAAIAVGGTLAYFQDKEDVTNTFTVGNINIKLDEANVNEYGQTTGGRTEAGNAGYKLIPGHEYTKDPTVTVFAGSEDSYVRMQVKISAADIEELKAAFPGHIDATTNVFLLQNFVDWDPAGQWEYKSYANGVYEFWYKDVVDFSTTDTELPPLFTTITIPDTATNADLTKLVDGISIDIVAHAIQADGFEDLNSDGSAADEAWGKFKADQPSVPAQA